MDNTINTVRATKTTRRMTIVFRLISALYQKTTDLANVYLNEKCDSTVHAGNQFGFQFDYFPIIGAE